MQNIYIAKPGGQKEGPYTLEQINRDLATKRINDTEFWAWHEGLPSWMPLHSVPGVSAKAGAAAAPEVKSQPATPKTAPEPVAPQAKSPPVAPKAANAPVPIVKSEPEKPKAEAESIFKFEPVAPKPAPQPIAPEAKPQPTPSKAAVAFAPMAKSEPKTLKVEATAPPVVKLELERPRTETTIPPFAEPKPEAMKSEATPVAKPELVAPTAQPEPKAQEILATPSMSSGKLFAALEQIFVFTTGEGPSAFKSEITAAMLSEAVGEKLEIIRSKVPVDVIGGTDAGVLEAIRSGSIPGSAWRALLKIKPAVAQRAQEGAYHLCVRTFLVESKQLVALFLLYNKQSL